MPPSSDLRPDFGEADSEGVRLGQLLARLAAGLVSTTSLPSTVCPNAALAVSRANIVCPSPPVATGCAAADSRRAPVRRPTPSIASQRDLRVRALPVALGRTAEAGRQTAPTLAQPEGHLQVTGDLMARGGPHHFRVRTSCSIEWSGVRSARGHPSSGRPRPPSRRSPPAEGRRRSVHS